MEKFTKPELLSFLCEGEYDEIAGNSPIVDKPNLDEF